MYLQAQSLQSEVLTSWKDKNGKFVRTFGMNTKRNHNMWRATWDSIKENIHTAIGMPGIAYEECDSNGCSLTHVEADTFEETVEKQKPFIKTKIVDFVLDESTESVDLIHEVIDDDFFEQLEKADHVKFVSPLIWPTNDGISINGSDVNKNGVELPVIDTYHWKFTHHAFLDSDPAYDDVALVKTTCDGDKCQIQMLGAKSLGGKTDNAMCGNCKFFVKDETCRLVKGKILYKDVCDLHIFGAVNPVGTITDPDFEKKRVNYRASKLEADTTTANQDNLSHLQETPLLYKHKGQMHLVAASQCVKDILHKKKEDGITIDDQALAIAFSECGQSNKAKSSFKTCTCDAKHKNMSDTENKILLKENESLKAKLKAQEDDKEKEKSFEAKKGRYAKLFADTTDDDREKMVAKLKGMDEDEHKAANEVHEELKKAKKADTDDPEKEEMKAQLKAMEDEHKKPMVAKLLKARSDKVTKDELNQYAKSLAAATYKEVKQRYDEQLPLFADSIKDTVVDNSTNFEFNGNENPLAGKTFAEIEADNN